MYIYILIYVYRVERIYISYTYVVKIITVKWSVHLTSSRVGVKAPLLCDTLQHATRCRFFILFLSFHLSSWLDRKKAKWKSRKHYKASADLTVVIGIVEHTAADKETKEWNNHRIGKAEVSFSVLFFTPSFYLGCLFLSMSSGTPCNLATRSAHKSTHRQFPVIMV